MANDGNPEAPSSGSPSSKTTDLDAAHSILEAPHGARLAYHQFVPTAEEAEQTGRKSPPCGVVFIHGFMSDQTGSKAVYLEEWCKKKAIPYVRFDQSGHGASSGRFTEGSIGLWSQDCLAIIDQLTQGPQILVGSSMGGWLMLLAALARPERIAGLVGIAPAPDFTEDMMWSMFSPEQRQTILEEGILNLPSEYQDSPYQISKVLIEDGRDHLVLREPLPISVPVHIVQGLMDASVPWERALTLQTHLQSERVSVSLIKDGEHRLSRPEDLLAITQALEAVIQAAGFADGDAETP